MTSVKTILKGTNLRCGLIVSDRTEVTASKHLSEKKERKR